MPAHIPHSYRKPSGVYYFRYVFPQSIRDRFPSLGADLRFSLKTKSHAEAKLRVYQNATIVNIARSHAPAWERLRDCVREGRLPSLPKGSVRGQRWLHGKCEVDSVPCGTSCDATGCV